MKPEIKILRTGKSDKALYGVVFDGDNIEFAICLQTINPYLPDGEYVCKQRQYYHGGYRTFEIIWPNSGHSEILFHKGNFPKDSKLCILIAESFEIIDGERAIAQSDKGFSEFWNKYKMFEEIKLTLRTYKGFD